MKSNQGSSTWRKAAGGAVVVFTLACAPSTGRGEGAATAAQGDRSAATINHLVPARDSSGGVPSRFEWTPVEGADRYAIGVWNEVDRLMWRQDDLRVPSIARPEELQLESGTYFWAVSALREDRQLADSGLSAFVVLR